MDVKEKLVELLIGYSIDTKSDVEYVVDHLIAHGVTVQECAGDDLTSALLALLDTVPAHQKLYPELYVDKIVKLIIGGK